MNAEELRSKFRKAGNGAAKPADDLEGIDGADLLGLDFPPLKWIREPYLMEGVTVLAGRPKKGKSWLALGWSIDIVRDGGEVLYMGLEDNHRRLQKRLKSILQGEELPRGFKAYTKWKKFDAGGLDDLRNKLQANKKIQLVVVDTMQKVRPRLTKGADPYQADYEMIGQLKAIADEFEISIIIVHHTRKADATDFIDSVSGSTGLTGGADAVLVLQRKPRSHVATLLGVGRDLEKDIDDALQFDQDTGRWTRIGDGEEYRESESRQELIRALRSAKEATPTELAAITGKTRDNINHQLLRLKLEGIVMANSKGKYRVIADPAGKSGHA
jgi:DNA-binding transcriptional ArsR family regulator